MTILRRLDATLAPTEAKVLAKDAIWNDRVCTTERGVGARRRGAVLQHLPLDFRRLLDDPKHIAANLRT